MERVNASLFRFGSPNRRGVSYTYLLLREEGNLLVGHQSCPSAQDIEDIDGLGGIESQWICHRHDMLRDRGHETLYEKFGCPLYHHKQDGAGIRKKTKCPTDHYGDEGLEYGPDFEVFYWPTCTAGHCIFRWRYRGKYYLFTSHAVYASGKEWKLGLNKSRMEALRSQQEVIASLQVDYIFPGYSALEESGYCRLDDQAKRSFARAVAAI